MPVLPPPPIQSDAGSFIWVDWYNQLSQYLNTANSVPWSVVNKAGSKLSDIAIRDHVMLTAVQGGNSTEQYHLSLAQYTALGVGTTGTGLQVLQTTPTILTPNITGTTAGGNAAAGSIGEFVFNSASSIAITSATPTNITSISLTAGDWDLEGSFGANPTSGSTTLARVATGINTTSATLPAFTYDVAGSYTTGFSASVVPPAVRVSVSTTTTVYLVGFCSYGVSTLTASGSIRARRIR